MDQDDVGRLLEAIKFASEKHAGQFRKGSARIPYINHPIAVAHLLYETGVSDIEVLIAAILHDVIEDAEITKGEISMMFGERVLNIVLELTDDMTLPQLERKQLQVDNASKLSNEAKMIRVADKICNLRDIVMYPIDWDCERKLNYGRWADKVVANCRGINPALDLAFEESMENFFIFASQDQSSTIGI